jgi:hypothetical protein
VEMFHTLWIMVAGCIVGLQAFGYLTMFRAA